MGFRTGAQDTEGGGVEGSAAAKGKLPRPGVEPGPNAKANLVGSIDSTACEFFLNFVRGGL